MPSSAPFVGIALISAMPLWANGVELAVMTWLALLCPMLLLDRDHPTAGEGSL